ncbi:hypothetical protein COX69_00860 [Candidatus Falkowbacteria bacterium CG_4_10_14_0_2_um_filter_48_10]|nr:MAG: hypothetical protein COX69_00860 [Candidatus Falkowbacteria bacterium CG_4_10_14_0_2_um_filter_48_10]
MRIEKSFINSRRFRSRVAFFKRRSALGRQKYYNRKIQMPQKAGKGAENRSPAQKRRSKGWVIANYLIYLL